MKSKEVEYVKQKDKEGSFADRNCTDHQFIVVRFTLTCDGFHS